MCLVFEGLYKEWLEFFSILFVYSSFSKNFPLKEQKHMWLHCCFCWYIKELTASKPCSCTGMFSFIADNEKCFWYTDPSNTWAWWKRCIYCVWRCRRASCMNPSPSMYQLLISCRFGHFLWQLSLQFNILEPLKMKLVFFLFSLFVNGILFCSI